jgi:hypothetical protein
MVSNKQVIGLLSEIYGKELWPYPLHILQGVSLVQAGAEIREVSEALRTTRTRIHDHLKKRSSVKTLLGLKRAKSEDDKRLRVTQMLGQLLLGQCAELVFEHRYRKEMGTQDLELDDLRESRSDTDYRVYNGTRRPLYRLNIKFHGSPFRRAEDMVGLAPEDCFALATYKIYNALEKARDEQLPYIFAIVGVPGLTGLSVGTSLDEDLLDLTTLVHSSPRFQGKRNFEDSVIQYLVRSRSRIFIDTYKKIELADWYVLSAQRADKLLREKLYERVFALRMPGFARQFGKAELDMHFSLSMDLTLLQRFFAILKTEGPTKVATMMAQGDI